MKGKNSLVLFFVLALGAACSLWPHQTFTSKNLPVTYGGALAQNFSLVAKKAVTSLAFSPDGKWIAAGERNWDNSKVGYIQIWNAEKRKQVGLWRAVYSVNSVAFSPDGRKIAAGEENGQIEIWNIATHKIVGKWGARAGINSVAFSPDGQELAAGEWDWNSDNEKNDGYIFRGYVQIWDSKTGKIKREWKTLNDVAGISFSPDGAEIATGESTLVTGKIELWNVFTGQRKASWKTNIFVRSIAFDPSGARIAAGGFDGSVYIWSLKGRVLSALKVGDAARSVAFSLDGRELAAGGNSFAKVWDVATGNEVFTWKSKQGISSVAFNPLRKELAVGESKESLEESDSRGIVELLALNDYDYYIGANKTPIKSLAGQVITLLPLGTQVSISKTFTSRWLWVHAGEKLEGWVEKKNIVTQRPDMFPPVIRLTKKSIKGSRLNVEGFVYSDKPLVSIILGNRSISNFSPLANKGNYRYGYSFKGSALALPNASLSISAQDAEGRQTNIPISISEPITKYAPQYALLSLIKETPILSSPKKTATTIKQVPAGTQLASVGYNNDFYALEGGGWVPKSSAHEYPGFIPAFDSAENVSVKNTVSPAILYKPSSVDADVPLGVRQKNAIGVIIANRDYQNPNVPAVKYALNDAQTVKKYFIKSFGISPKNIIYLENATKGEMESVFGKKGFPHGELYDYALSQGPNAEIYIYYSGHGAPDLTTKKPYLVPVDADPDYIALNGYPLETLYSNLNHIPARSAVVILDACFSGSSPSGMLIKNASPLEISVLPMARPPLSGLIFAASGPDQVANWYPKKNHSLFTYFFLKGLQQRAGLLGKTKTITAKNLESYLKDQVSAIALKEFHRKQSPALFGYPNRILLRYR